MRTDNGRTVSFWMATADTPAPGTLTGTVDADVCIVGAGIAGLTAAYLLTREGKRVVVLDDGPIAGGETARTTAHLVFYNDDGMSVIERLHGLEGLRLATESHSAAVDKIEQIVREEAIDCDFLRTDGYLFVSPNGQGHDFLQQEFDAAHRVGLNDAQWVERAPLPSFDTGRCLRYPRQAQFHPLKYLRALTSAIAARGGLVFHNTHATNVQGGDDDARVETATGGTVTCKAVIVATNTPVNDRFAIHTKQQAWRTYAIGMRIPRGSIPAALYWDTEDPYHYVRTNEIDGDPEHLMLISGGEDHETGRANDPDQRWKRLEQWTRERFPMCGPLELWWSGQYMEPIDYLAYSGRNPGDADNVYIHTGDSGMGMTHGTLGGILLTDLIQKRDNAWAKLYDPSRANPKAAHTFVKENVMIAAQYRDWATPGKITNVSEIAPGTGAVMRMGLTKVAVFKGEDHSLHTCSAVCPHLGCIVRWNYAERSWDCPCHGSRFDPYGKVVNGPANSGLPVVESGQVPPPPASDVPQQQGDTLTARG
jgi:glycine/D-amino acid oxidase-like deaminating enzyme/nitrite reductase/ring-hydroxylating ferredoxin subunit